MLDQVFVQLEASLQGIVTQVLDIFNALPVFVQAGALAVIGILSFFGIFGFVKFFFKFALRLIMLVIIVGIAYVALVMAGIL